MIIKNIREFGNFKPGDVVEVPDGAIFDEFYFQQVPAEGGSN